MRHLPAPGADPLVSVLEEIDIFKRLMAAYPEKIAPVYTAADLERNLSLIHIYPDAQARRRRGGL